MDLVIANTKSFPCVIVKKDISSHLRSCKFSDPENEVDLVLPRAGISETPYIMLLKGEGRGAYWRAYSTSLIYDVRRNEVQ